MDLNVINSWQSGTGERRWGLLLSEVGTVDHDRIEAYYESYSALARRFHGEYDGYGSIIHIEASLDNTSSYDGDVPKD